MEYNSENNTGENSKNILGQVWAKYFPYWPVFLVLTALCIAGAWFYLKKATPLYESAATLLIKDEKKGIDDSKMIESLNLISNKKIVENEIEVLKSRSLMSEVVMNLHLYAPIYQVGKWRNNSAYSSAPFTIAAKDPASITGVKKIEFTYDTIHSQVMIDKSGYALNDWVTTPYGVLKFLPLKPVAKNRTGPLYFSLVNPKEITQKLMSRLEATPSSKLSTVIDLKIRDEDPLLAENILNELLLCYTRAAVNDKNALSENTLAFVQERLDFVGSQLDSTERKIQQYKSNKGAVDISAQGKLFLENVSTNDQKISDINMQLAMLGQVEKYVREKDNKGGIVPSTFGITDPLLTDLLTKLYNVEIQIEKLKKTTGEGSFEMLSLVDQVEKIKPSILENIQSQRKSLDASKIDLASTNNAYSTLLQSIPQKERDLVEISRQQSIQSNIYSFLLQKREEAALSNSSTVADNRVVDSAESSLLPVSPNGKLIYAMALIIAIGLGISIITAKEVFSRTILYRSEIEVLTEFPIIGEIGYEKSTDPIVIKEGTTSLLAEQFRKLRASLGFIGVGAKRKKILITSTIPGEGKSFIVANLGLTLALTGKKVILIEADLSNPALSDKLSINVEKGLSSYLTGECDPEEIIKRTILNSNLFLLPAGVLPPNPSELIMNGRIAELMVYLEGIFDYILVDSAPVGALSDAYTLAPLCDATLYVVRHGHTPKIAIERLDKNNKITELKNGAIVFNAVRSRGFGKESYGDGYGYGYVYDRKRIKKMKKLLSGTLGR